MKTSQKETAVSTTDGSPLELTREETQVAMVKDEEKAASEGICGRINIDDGVSTTQVVKQLMLVEQQHREVQV